MNRNNVRWAVLTALGITAQSAAATPGLIPEVIAEAEPKTPSIEQLVRTRFVEAKWLPSPDTVDPVGRAQRKALEAQLPLVPSLIGTPVDAYMYGGQHRVHLLSTQGRIDTVLVCLNHGRLPDACDLTGLLSPQEALKRSGGSPLHGSREIWLDHDFTYTNLVVSCPNPVRTGGCGGLRVNARTGACEQQGRCVRGRAFGEGRVASLVGEVRTVAGEAWARIALEEHASVASFARHTMELLAVGAPMELIEASSQAQLDEVRHAASALALARSFGAEVEIGALDTTLLPRTELFDILLAVAKEGCLSETLAATECAIALEQTESPEVRRVLEQIVADESEHAALAWRTLAWGLPKLRSDQRRQVLEVFDTAVVHGGPATPTGIGVLGGEEARNARIWALEHVVRPAVAAIA